MKETKDRMREKRKQLKLTQKEVAQRVGVTAGAVTQWEIGMTAPKGENLHTLCRTLQCTPEWLLYGTGNPDSGIGNSELGPPILGKIPVISWVQAGKWTEILENFDQKNIKEWIQTTAKIGLNAFALRVRGDSMVNPVGFPSIPEGSIVTVEPDIQAENGNIVVALLESSQEATIKKLVIDTPNKYLMALNPNYRPIQIGEDCKIIGVVKQVTSFL